MPDGDLSLGNPLPKIVPHAPRDFAVQLTYAVAKASETQRQHGHAKILLIVCLILAPQAQKLRRADTKAWNVRLKILLDHPRRKIIMARRDRSVSGEHETGRGKDFCFPKRELSSLHEANHAFQPEESGVPFIHVINRRSQPDRFERS